MQLDGDLPVQGLLVGFDRQEEVGPLLLEELKNGPGCAAHPPG